MAYNAIFKFKDINFAELSNNSVSARTFILIEKQMLECWQKKKRKNSKNSKINEHAYGRKSTFSALEEKLTDFLQMSLQSRFIVTRTKICIMALNIIKDLNLLSFKPIKFCIC